VSDAVVACNLTKRFEGGCTALDNVNVRVGFNEVYCLLGTNGAGKTTAINLMLGFLEPTSGSVHVCGVDVAKDPHEARRRIAYVPENVQLYPMLTAIENLRLFTRLATGQTLNSYQYAELFQAVGLDDSNLTKPLRFLSKGSRQKVGLAMALARNASVLLLDEPTSGLDPRDASEVVETLLSIRNKGRALFIVTHDIFRVNMLADRLGVLVRGRLAVETTRCGIPTDGLYDWYMDAVNTWKPSVC